MEDTRCSPSDHDRGSARLKSSAGPPAVLISEGLTFCRTAYWVAGGWASFPVLICAFGWLGGLVRSRKALVSGTSCEDLPQAVARYEDKLSLLCRERPQFRSLCMPFHWAAAYTRLSR